MATLLYEVPLSNIVYDRISLMPPIVFHLYRTVNEAIAFPIIIPVTSVNIAEATQAA